MGYHASIEDIEREYARLKQGSRGREAVNPQDFVRYVRRVNLDLECILNGKFRSIILISVVYDY